MRAYRTRSKRVITGSIARSARRRYLIYSEADFEVFRPARATRCTNGGEIWHGGSVPNFTAIGATAGKGIGPTKTEIFTKI